LTYSGRPDTILPAFAEQIDLLDFKPSHKDKEDLLMKTLFHSRSFMITVIFGLLLSITTEAADTPVQPETKSLVTTSQEPLIVTLDIGNVRQEIQGFGASDCWSIQYVGTWPEATVNAIADLLFSTELEPSGKPKGIGLSQWRMNLGAGSARRTDIRDSWRRGDFFYNDDLTEYDWSRCAGQRRFLQLAKNRGVHQFTAFSNSPPYTMTKNGYAFCDPEVGSTNLDPNKVDAFVTYIADVIEHFKTAEEIEFTSISPINEPEWDWNGTLLDDVAYSVNCINVLLRRRQMKTMRSSLQYFKKHLCYILHMGIKSC